MLYEIKEWEAEEYTVLFLRVTPQGFSMHLGQTRPGIKLCSVVINVCETDWKVVNGITMQTSPP